ncbi:MAG TPA: tetratricopeptide repeat protein [Allosphingosinicella sp.]|uniref:tetratricopeptide repeat protein n=1 Tax=Allosphingosinicella sp. TaxID=2823234 RepID=UPI002F27008C
MGEVRITRTCKRAALAIGAALLLPVSASANVDERAELAAYARARGADTFGASADAARGYAALLALSPGNELVAARALSQAMAAGDYQVALQAARILDRSGRLAPDSRLLLLTEALRTRDWKEAETQVAAIESDRVYSFMVPILRAWIAVDRREGDPLAILEAAKANPLATVYAAEHRPFLLIAAGKRKEAAAELLKVIETGGARAQRLRIAAAASLQRKDREGAAALLVGETAPIRAARELLANRKTIPGAISGARAGIAEFLARVAIDLHGQNATALGLAHARLSTFLAPENSETWLVTSELLAAQEKNREALAVLASVQADDPFAGSATDSRARLLVAVGDKDAAIAQAEAAAARPSSAASDWVRLGELYLELERPADSARAYGEAIARVQAAPATGEAEWTLWLLRGSALDEAGRWPEAKAALEQAHKLAPDQPLVLNYLGYSQLERRENLAEAERLIREASRLRPDDAAITDSLGWAHYIRGNLPSAITLLEKAALGQPADPAINEHLGDAYYSAGRRFEARYAWEAALLYAEDEDAARLRAKIEAGLTPKLAAP